MRTLLVAIVMFALGFIVGGGIGVNFTLNSAYDYMLKNMQNTAKLPDNASVQLKAIFEKEKEKMLTQLSKQKDEIINNLKESIKKQLQDQIEKIFNIKKQ